MICRAVCACSALVRIFVGFWDRDYVSQLPCVMYYFVVNSSFKHTHEKYGIIYLSVTIF